MPANILNLLACEVLSVEHDDHDYHVNVEVIQPPTHCLLRDVPIQRRQETYVGNRRMRCLGRDQILHETLLWCD